jgi:hypothetical protein
VEVYIRYSVEVFIFKTAVQRTKLKPRTLLDVVNVATESCIRKEPKEVLIFNRFARNLFS